jgi:hypothetical protein
VSTLSEHVSPQEFVVLVRSSVIPGLDYLRRLVPVEAAKRATKHFDTVVLRQLQKKMEWEIGVREYVGDGCT